MTEHAGNRTLLPKSEWKYSMFRVSGDVHFDILVIGCYVRDGCVEYEEFALSNLPNNFVNDTDLETIRKLGDRVSVYGRDLFS